jgi:hypothetical protein
MYCSFLYKVTFRRLSSNLGLKSSFLDRSTATQVSFGASFAWKNLFLPFHPNPMFVFVNEMLFL